ncbi:MAG: hypothetical protein KJO52_12235 [Maribacter sp.]|nr:hypothetical protein [Maribacter sp.]
MKKKVFFVLLLCICSKSKAQITISEDKPKHFAAGMVIGGIGGYAAHKIFKRSNNRTNRFWTWTGAVGSSLAAGLTKEALDKADYGVWDNNDVLFTTLGGIVSGLALELLIKRKVPGRIKVTYTDDILNQNLIKNNKVLNIANYESHDVIATLQAQRILEMP